MPISIRSRCYEPVSEALAPVESVMEESVLRSILRRCLIWITSYIKLKWLSKNIDDDFDPQFNEKLQNSVPKSQIDYYFYKFKIQTQIPILTPGLPRSFNGKFRHQENQWFSYEMLLWLHDKPHCFLHILILFKLCRLIMH